MPWYKDIKRFGQTNFTEDDPKNCDIDFWANYWKELDVQGVIINCGGIVSYYQSDLPFQYKAKFLGQRDMFKEYSDRAKQMGIYVVARMDIQLLDENFYNAHPSWFSMDKNGNPLRVGEKYVPCVNGKYYKEYIPSVLKEIIEKYNVNGFADNSWKGLPKNSICYCPTCQKEFKEKYGLELPTINGEGYKQWIEWSFSARKANWILFNDTTKKYGGEDCLWCGMLNGNSFGSNYHFVDIYELGKLSKIVFLDHQNRNSENGFWENALNGNLLHQIVGEDVIIIESMAHYYRGKHTYRIASPAPCELRQWMWTGFAGGISPWYHHVGGYPYDMRKINLTKDIFKWHKDSEKYLYNRNNMARVAVAWCDTKFLDEDVKESMKLAFYGICNILSNASIPFMPIYLEDLKEDCTFETIILPQAISNNSICNVVDELLKKGKNIIFSGKDNGLLELFGFELKGAMKKKADISSDWTNDAYHSYISIPKEPHEIFMGFEDTTIIPFGGEINVLDNFGEMKGITGNIPAFPIYPPEFSWIREFDDNSTIYVGQKHSGRVIYLAGNIDECYGRDKVPDLKKLLQNCIKWCINKNQIQINVGNILSTLYKQEDYFILHLVNLNGTECAPGTLESIIPIFNIHMNLSLDMDITSVKAINLNKDLEIKNNEFYLESLVEHELLIIS